MIVIQNFLHLCFSHYGWKQNAAFPRYLAVAGRRQCGTYSYRNKTCHSCHSPSRCLTLRLDSGGLSLSYLHASGCNYFLLALKVRRLLREHRSLYNIVYYCLSLNLTVSQSVCVGSKYPKRYPLFSDLQGNDPYV